MRTLLDVVFGGGVAASLLWAVVAIVQRELHQVIRALVCAGLMFGLAERNWILAGVFVALAVVHIVWLAVRGEQLA